MSKISEKAHILLEQYTTSKKEYVKKIVDTPPNVICQEYPQEAKYNRDKTFASLVDYIAELESTNEVCNDVLNAYDKQRSEIVKLSNDTVNKLIARAERAEQMITRLIGAGNILADGLDTYWQECYPQALGCWHALVTEWKAQQ